LRLLLDSCVSGSLKAPLADSKVAAELLRSTEELSRAGAQVDIRRYAGSA
jgi:hypothetical protein